MRMRLLSLFAWACMLGSLRAAGDLPILQKNAVILFQGDSITDGGRQRTGSDYNHIMGQCYAYIIAADVGAIYPEKNFTFVNRGISGNTVLDLTARWQTDTLALKPNLLSILVGVNDTFFSKQPEPIEQFRDAYDKLLSDTLAALPGVKIVLGQPFLLPVGKFKDQYPAKLAELKQRADVVAQLASKYHLPLIRYQDVFDQACSKAPADHWSWDGVHPTYAGHGLMAQAWLTTVNALQDGKHSEAR
jgi:lysophospholipase L1-like esterase